MGASGWLQLAALGVALLVGARVLGAYIARVFGGRAAARGPRLRAGRARDLPRRRRRRRSASSAGRVYARSVLAFSAVSVLGLYAAPARPGRAVPQPDRRDGRPSGARLQHRRQLRHQHELAELRRRVDDEPPHADERARRAELRLGGGRHGGRDRARPRHHAAPQRDDRQLLGRPHARRSRASCCRSRSSLALVLVARGRDPELRRLHRGATRSQGATQVDPRRAVREPGGDQGARHERRRDVQRQLGAPVREPDAVHEPARDLRAAPDPVRARLRVRPAGRSDTRQGWAVLAAMAILLGRAALALAGRPRVARQPARSRRSAPSGAEHGGQGERFGAPASGALRRVDDRHVDGAVDSDARQLHAARRRRAARRT